MEIELIKLIKLNNLTKLNFIQFKLNSFSYALFN